MRRLTLRVLFALVGVCLLVVYLGAAYGAFVVLSLAWQARPDPAATLLLLALLTVVFGYGSYRYGTRRLLASMDARPLPRGRFPAFYRRLDRLCERMDLAEPAVLAAAMGVPNAIALGGVGPGAIVFDVGLFRLLDPDELEAVLAHELAHLESRDSLIQTLAYSFAQSAVGLLVFVLLPVTLAVTGLARAAAFLRGHPTRWDEGVFGDLHDSLAGVVALAVILLTLLVRAHSRGREFHADDRAVDVTDDPAALARALRKIERASEPPQGVTAPLYTYGDEDGTLSRWLSTHPSMDARVERLRDRYNRTRDRDARDKTA
ncbi:M48 family metalloprotease [Halocalculus aciditolerans]|uniref:Protease HtpX n=1 Tax=Halocalculus aciditolerans TaxID=1383812 RepID=A0A830FML5_9EURY|nr:M48 family metalloprotease [Halocalculus aciditolerans]GGL67679.1 protease HtpX [Halocalculus aciditolerans]